MILEKDKYYLYSKYGTTITVEKFYKGSDSPQEFLHKYVKDKNNKLLSFDSEIEAIVFLNANYMRENIDMNFIMPPKPYDFNEQLFRLNMNGTGRKFELFDKLFCNVFSNI